MKNWRLFFPCLMIGLIGTFLATHVYRLSLAHEREQLKASFDLQTHFLVEAIESRYKKYGIIFKGISSFFISSKEVDFNEWNTYCGSLNASKDFPAITFLSFVQDILPMNKESSVQKIRENGVPEFKIWPESTGGPSYPIVFVYPTVYSSWVGYDLSQNRDVVSLIQAQKSFVGPPFNLNKLAVKKSEITLWYPIQKPEQPGALFGWAVGAVDLNTMIDRVSDEVGLSQINLQLFAKEKKPENLILARIANPDPTPLFSSEKTVQFGPDTWILFCSTGPQYEVNLDYTDARILLATMICSTLLLMGIVYFYITEKETLVQAGVTADETVKITLKMYQSLFDSIDYAIIGTDQKGLITLFNKAAEKMLGFTAQEMIGKQTPETFHDPEEMKARAKELSNLFGKTILPRFEVFVALAEKGIPEERVWNYIRKDKSVVAVNLRVIKVKDEHEVPIGYVGIAQYKK